MSRLLLTTIMLAAGIGMVVGLVKQRSAAAWAKPLTVACALIALVCALAHMVPGDARDPDEIVERNELEYLRISTEKLGRYLAQKYAGSKALVLVDPPSAFNQERTAALLRGLESGLAGKISIEARKSPDPPETARQTVAAASDGATEDVRPPMDYWLTAEAFDALIEKHTETCDLVITMIGVPSDVSQMRLWNLSNRPKLALACGSVYELRGLIASGDIVAAVAFSPEAVFGNEEPPGDIEAAFRRRFLLLTPENVEGLAAKYKGLGFFL